MSARVTVLLFSSTEIPSILRKYYILYSQLFFSIIFFQASYSPITMFFTFGIGSVQDIEKKYYADGEDAYACRKTLQ